QAIGTCENRVGRDRLIKLKEAILLQSVTLPDPDAAVFADSAERCVDQCGIVCALEFHLPFLAKLASFLVKLLAQRGANVFRTPLRIWSVERNGAGAHLP